MTLAEDFLAALLAALTSGLPVDLLFPGLVAGLAVGSFAETGDGVF
jgi:hypothetical protein